MTHDDPNQTSAWSGDNAYAIELTEWTVKAWDPKGPSDQAAGTASGRVFIAYKGDKDFKNSGAAGTFSKAIVRYSGEPEWLKKPAKK